jgi:hypothetical protein
MGIVKLPNCEFTVRTKGAMSVQKRRLSQCGARQVLDVDIRKCLGRDPYESSSAVLFGLVGGEKLRFYVFYSEGYYR